MPQGPARAAFLRERCAGDPLLLARLERFLSAETAVGAWAPGAGGAAPRFAAASRVGRYAILNPIGEGGMGVVFAAYDERLDRRVALKVLRHRPDADSQVRLLREAQALAQITHPNVVAVHDAGETEDGHVFLAMELVEGKNLRAWADGRSWREIVRAHADAGRALACVHAGGLVHRDFKPENVLVDAAGRVRVADFGLAARVDRSAGTVGAAAVAEVGEPVSSAGSPKDPVSPAMGPDGQAVHARRALSPPQGLLGHALTRAGTLMGTPGYIAPEVRRGEIATAASDQFAFCVSLHEAIFERHPASDRSPASSSASPAADRSGLFAGAPRAELLRLLQRGLEPEPQARHPSMETLVTALDRLSGAGVEADTHAEQRTRVLILSLILLMAVILSALVISRGHGRTIVTPRGALLFSLGPALIILLSLAAARTALGRSRLNRQFGAIIALIVVAFVGHRAFSVGWGIRVEAILAGDAFVMGAMVAVAAVVVGRWLAVVSAVFMAGALAATLFPNRAEVAFGAATLLGTIISVLRWRPLRRRPGAGLGPASGASTDGRER